MAQRIVTFFGHRETPTGLPFPFHRYFILEDSAPSLGEGIRIVSVVSITDNSPLPRNLKHFIVRNLASEQAIEQAIEHLRELPQMQDLEMH
jgi:hypothetical protein